jgi:hypothetical protein
MTSRKDEIKEILINLLKNEDIVLKILNMEKKIMINESKIYWSTLIKNNIYNVNPYFTEVIVKPGKIINLHKQIIRMNGSLKNVKEENEQLKIIQKNNELWAEGWMRGIRF